MFYRGRAEFRSSGCRGNPAVLRNPKGVGQATPAVGLGAKPQYNRNRNRSAASLPLSPKYSVQPDFPSNPKIFLASPSLPVLSSPQFHEPRGGIRSINPPQEADSSTHRSNSILNG